ncbi:glycosyltransferase family 4 protein [uncultured Castellaniella sp.]|uniref:glycosyltransferase family 4 protein n=1 Tax=uncultured Castellaniella sp. TaxID=647907 RepID=UPI002618C148|nr:glycosyltransferase family 4 protein [uncultured Castellaniella sp.]
MTSIAIVAHHAVDMLNFRGDLIKALCAAGVRVVCLAPDYTDKESSQVRDLGAEPVSYSLQRTGMNPLRDLADALALARLLRRLRPDIVFVFSIKPVIYGSMAAWLARVPRRVAMIEGAGYAFTDTGQPIGWKRRVLRALVCGLYRVALSRVHRVVFLNEDDRRDFESHRLADPGRSVVLGGIGVDLDAWPVAPAVTEPVTFILVARLLREKGIVQFADAARQVLRQHPGARFILLGRLDTNPGGLGQAEVESWVREGILEWPGHVAVRPWLSQASVFVLPSFYREGVPRSTQEAMAMGRPVITTDSTGCRDTVDEGVNGYLVPVRDVDALTRAMLRFVDEPASIAEMGAASRRMAEERFDVRKVNQRLINWLLG